MILGLILPRSAPPGERIRHSDLDSYLLYNGGSVSARGGAQRQDETIKVVGLRRKIAENMAEGEAHGIPDFTLGRGI